MDYRVISDNYGNYFSDYMGNAILIPRKYSLLDVNITKVGDLAPRARSPPLPLLLRQ